MEKKVPDDKIFNRLETNLEILEVRVVEIERFWFQVVRQKRQTRLPLKSDPSRGYPFRGNMDFLQSLEVLQSVMLFLGSIRRACFGNILVERILNLYELTQALHSLPLSFYLRYPSHQWPLRTPPSPTDILVSFHQPSICTYFQDGLQAVSSFQR